MDYLFFFNANMELVAPISLSDLGLGSGKDLVAFKHPGFYNLDNNQFTYDRNPDSLAYIPMGEGKYYVMGSFNGGTREAYLELCHELKRRITEDEKRGIIALWHDESQLNRYLYDYPERFSVLEHSYGYPEEWLVSSFLKSCLRDYKVLASQASVQAKIIIRNKAHARFGGHLYLRGQSDDKALKLRLQAKLYDYCHKLLRLIQH